MALLRHNIKGLSTKPPYTNTPPNNPHPLYPKIPHPSPIITPMSPSESQLSPPELPPASREIKVDVLSHASPPDDRGTRAGGNLTSIIFFRMFSFHSFSLDWLLADWLAWLASWLPRGCGRGSGGWAAASGTRASIWASSAKTKILIFCFFCLGCWLLVGWLAGLAGWPGLLAAGCWLARLTPGWLPGC